MACTWQRRLFLRILPELKQLQLRFSTRYCSTQIQIYSSENRQTFLNHRKVLYVSVRYVQHVQNHTDDDKSEKFMSYHSLVSHLKDYLQLSVREAASLVSTYPDLEKINPNETKKLLKYLTRKGFKFAQLRNNPWLLIYSENELERKIVFIENQLGKITDELIFLLDNPEKQLEKTVMKLVKEKNSGLDRFDFLKEELETSGADLNKLLYTHEMLTGMTFNRLRDKINLLKSHGFTAEEIRRDVGVMHRSLAAIEDTIQTLQKLSIKPIRFWMFKCKPYKLHRLVNRLNRYRDVLKNHEDVRSYLAERLQKPLEIIDRQMVARHPRLTTVNPPKVKEILDLLFSFGYGSEEIANHPRIFRLSVKTLERRLLRLKKLGCGVVDLGLLYRTAESFEIIVDKLKRK